MSEHFAFSALQKRRSSFENLLFVQAFRTCNPFWRSFVENA